MTISADTSIILDAHSPKKDATVGEGDPATAILTATTSCAIWANTITDPSFTTQTIATYWTLFRAAADLAKQGGTGIIVAAGDIDTSEPGVAFAAPTAGQIGIYIGGDLNAKGQTHFIDRTLKRLCERWLELAKTGAGDAPARRAGVSLLDDNTWDFEGNFRAGDSISITLQVTDPDGLAEGDSVVLLLPALPPGLVYNPSGVAEIVCQWIAALVHYRCVSVGSVITIGPAAPANTVTSNLAVLLGS
jgi:hypothetical protein